jgi:WD40 repeat protein
VAVSGGADRTVRVWDLAAGAPLGEPLTGHSDRILALAVAEVEGRPVAVSAGWDGTVRVWDLAAGAPLGEPLTGHTDGVLAVAVGELEGRPVAVSAGWDRTVRVWGGLAGDQLVIDTGATNFGIALAGESRVIVAAAMGLLVIQAKNSSTAY